MTTGAASAFHVMAIPTGARCDLGCDYCFFLKKERLYPKPGLNWLCAGLEAFFGHTDRPMRIMADLLRRGRSAPDVMAILAAQEQPSEGARRPDPVAAPAVRRTPAPATVGRNKPCPCGSGRKFKLCHG